MKERKNLIFLIIGIPLIAVFLAIFNIGRALELKFLDWHFILRGSQPASDKLFVVVIGDESVSPEAFGRWPWRRANMAIFINLLIPYKPHSIVFDILFTEPSGESLDGIDDDAALAEQASLMGNVLFPFYGIFEVQKSTKIYRKELPLSSKRLIDKINLGKVSKFKKADFFNFGKNIVMPIPQLTEASSICGYVNVVPDMDGVRRRMPLVMQYKDCLVPSLAFSAAIDYLGVKKENIIIKPGKHIILKGPNGRIKIPVDKKCQMLVNHTGKFFGEQNISHVSFFSLIQAQNAMDAGEQPKFDIRTLKDKIIVIGLTATGTSDLRPTPFSPIFPMVAFQTTIVSNIIRGNFLRPVSRELNYLIILIAGLIASFITVRFRAIPSALLNIVFFILYFFISFLLFKNEIVITTFYPFMAVVLSYTAITIYRFTGEEKEKKIIRGTFQRYVSSQVVDVLLEHPDQIKLGGERKRLTVFFSDIRGFTSMSEKLQPEEVVSILNEYLTEMIDIIFKYNGTLDKFIGDAVMAVWGAPVEQKNHAELAVRAAWAMREKVLEMREKWKKEGKKQIGVGMGVNTGDVVVGNMGSDQFADYTVIGDNVNLAARLEENAKAGQLIISGTTYEEVKDIIEVKDLDPLKVKGKEKPVKVYEVIGLKKH